jgi:hypothetical protein
MSKKTKANGSTKKPTKVSLVDFVKLQKKADCPVCKLPVEVRGQLGRVATEKKIPRSTQIEWIKLRCGVKITDEQLTMHNNGRHDAS